MSDTPIEIMGRPIEFSEVESFEVRLSAPQHADPMGSHRHRAKKASDMEDKEVSTEDIEALRWVREKKGVVELGKPYTISRYSDALKASYKEDVPARPVAVEVPVFYPATSRYALGRGPTLRLAVEAAKAVIESMGPGVRTYPEFNDGLDRVLLKVGSADFRVADLCALIRDYYDDHSTGGALHCVLDDGNMGDGHIESFDPDDKAACLIAELLKLVPEDERKKLYERGYGR